MIPIHELLNRIRWDQDFGQGEFEIGFFDRQEETIERVAFQDALLTPGDNRGFELIDPLGHHRHIPFHRVREVYKNGQLIWQRSTDE